VGKVYRLISFFTFLIVAINVFIPDVMTFIYPIDFPQLKEIKWIGYALIHISCIWIFIAQRNMSDEWRIGIDIENKVKLITKGLFSISRNPIFLGVIVLFVGIFLIIPNLVTVVILITGIIVIQIQVRLEEEFLMKKLGEEYMIYMNQVKRWLF
jgi:protein-S-isoprenylcysteine O-methyltransferase Ste14